MNVQVTKEMITAWQVAVIQAMYKKGATDYMFQQMSATEQVQLKDYLESQFAFTINPAILEPVLPIGHPALAGPAAVGADAYERFFT